MKIRLVEYNKWYYPQKIKDKVHIYIEDINLHNDLSKIFRLLFTLIQEEKLMMIFNDLNFFEDEITTKQLLLVNEKIFNEKYDEYKNIIKITGDRIFSIGKISKKDLDKDDFLNIWNCYDSSIILGISNDSNDIELDNIITNNHEFLSGDNIIDREYSNISFSIINNGNFVDICVNKNKIDLNNIIENINSILQTDKNI